MCGLMKLPPIQKAKTMKTINHEVTNEDPLMSITDAAKYCGVGQTTMYQLIQRHNLPTIRLTSDTKIRKSTLEHFINSKTEKR